MIDVAAPAFAVSAIELAKSSRFNRLFGSSKLRAFASLSKTPCDGVQGPLMMALAYFDKIGK